jgi:hypothetical protein
MAEFQQAGRPVVRDSRDGYPPLKKIQIPEKILRSTFIIDQTNNQESSCGCVTCAGPRVSRLAANEPPPSSELTVFSPMHSRFMFRGILIASKPRISWGGKLLILRSRRVGVDCELDGGVGFGNGLGCILHNGCQVGGFHPCLATSCHLAIRYPITMEY